MSASDTKILPGKLVPGMLVRHKERTYELATLNMEGNSAPIGFLWLKYLDNNATIGLLHLLSGDVKENVSVDDFLLNVKDMTEMKLLADYYFPHPKTFKQKLLALFKKTV